MTYHDIILAPLMLVSWAQAQNQDQPEYFYSYFKQAIPLALDTTRIAILASDPENQHFDLHRHEIDGEDLSPWATVGWSVAAVPEDAQHDAGISQLVRQVSEDAANVQFVSPMLMDECGPVIITPVLLVGFGESVDERHAEMILKAAHPGEILDAHYARMENVYRYRCKSRSGLEVLNAANVLAQHALVNFAEPDMVRTGETLTNLPTDGYFFRQWGLHNSGQNIFTGLNEICCPCSGFCSPSCPDLCASSGFGIPCENMPLGTPGFDVGAVAAWKITTGNPEIIVVVFDSGVRMDHPDLMLDPSLAMDFTGSGGNGFPYECETHGTLVAGTIGAKMNGMGVVGLVPDCRVASAKISLAAQLNPCAGEWQSWQPSWIIAGLEWAQTIGARVTNHSYFIGQSSALTTKFELTRAAGMIHFAAAGNSGNDIVRYPASLPTVNGISGLDHWVNGRAASSSYGPGLAFSAPFTTVSTYDVPGTPYANDCNLYTFSMGTSHSSPFAASVAAMILSIRPSLAPAQVEQIMRDSAVDLPPSGYDIEYGWGFVNAANAVITPPRAGDANGDDVVNVNDLLSVINAWGPCPASPQQCPADIAPAPATDGVVNVNDLLMVINNWSS